MKPKKKRVTIKNIIGSFLFFLIILNIVAIIIHVDIFRMKFKDEKEFVKKTQSSSLNLFKKITQEENLEGIKRDINLLLTAYELEKDGVDSNLEKYIDAYLRASKKYLGIEIKGSSKKEISVNPKDVDDKVVKILSKSFDSMGNPVNIVVYYDLYDIIKMFNEYEKLTSDTLYFLKSNGDDLNKRTNYPSFKEKFSKEWTQIELMQEGSLENENGIFSFITFTTLRGMKFELQEMDNWILVIRYSDSKIRDLINDLISERLFVTKYMEIPIIFISFFIAYLLARRKNLYEELQNTAIYDSLTSVYNRGGGLTLLDETRRLLKRSKESISLCYINIRGLKKINDRYGHSEGDQVLVNSAGIFSELVRESDAVVRMGGDEFLLIFPRCKEQEQSIIAGRLEEKIRNYNMGSGKGYQLNLGYFFIEITPYNMESISEILKVSKKDFLYTGNSKF